MSEIDDEVRELVEAPPKRRRPLLPLLLIAVLLVGGVFGGGTWAVKEIRDRFASAPDYPGPGTGKVLVEVAEGDSAAAIGRKLKEGDVVKSVQAFIDAARQEEKARSIQVGFYELKKQMKASAALEVLIDPANQRTTGVTVPEGLRVVDVIDILVEKTDFKRAQFEKALQNTAALGLPEYADGNAEGYLFPATYAFAPNARPLDMLKAMVDRWHDAADAAGLEASAEKMGYTPHELMTIASLVEAEGRGDDMNKIARVIYNRLEGEGSKGGTNGLLQIDATVNYALGRKGTTALSNAETQGTDSPYNTYRFPGLPPGPVEAPGAEAIEAASNPAEGGWYYYVTVNLRTGETKFAKTYEEFLEYKAEYQEYCRTQSKRC